MALRSVTFLALCVAAAAGEQLQAVAIDEHGAAIHFDDPAATFQGKMFLSDGTYFHGQLVNGKPEGKGRADSPDGMSYVGEFLQGKPSGRGTLLRADEEGKMQILYEGNFQAGRPSGLGAVFRAEAGGRMASVAYKGEFENGRIKRRSSLARQSSLAEVGSNDPDAREYIRIHDKSTGELRAVTIPGGFRLGDRVEAKISFKGHTGELVKGDIGTVIGTSSSDPQRQLKCHFPNYKELSLLATQISKVPLKVGDEVLCRDAGEQWKNGIVTSTTPLLVQASGWADSFAWSEVRLPQEVITTGMKVKALEEIAYLYQDPALNYQIPAASSGVVEEVDAAGHALVQWGELGQRWVRTESFSKLAEDTPVEAPGSLASFAETALEVVDRWSQRAFGNDAVGRELSEECTRENTVWDLTPAGALGVSQLERAGCVVALEANPDKVAYVDASSEAGRLHLFQGVLAQGAVGSEREYWVNKADSRLSGWQKNVTCLQGECKKTFVSVVPCSYLFRRFGTPAYIKMGAAAGGCFEELVARKGRGEDLPQFVSAEIPSKQHPALQLRKLGYTKFKLVQREAAKADVWGNAALDCGEGADWRDFTSFQEVAQYLKENAADATCPWNEDGSIVYDVHASM